MPTRWVWLRILNERDRETYRRWSRIVALAYASLVVGVVVAAALGSYQPGGMAGRGQGLRHPG